MSLRTYIDRLIDTNQLVQIKKPVSKTYEAAGILKKLEPKPVLFRNVKESPFPIIGNLFCTKTVFADYFGISPAGIIPMLMSALEQRSSGTVISSAPCQDVIHLDPDLDLLPLLKHCDKDGGNYITSGIMITCHPEYGQNVDFHRLMQFSKTQMAVRVVRNRHFDTFLQNCRQIDVAICIGNPPNILAAAATSVAMGINEMEIANALELIRLTPAKTVDLLVPADSEFVIEGTVYLDRKHPEGPFVDLTETYDVVREEPTFEIKAITHRHDAIWHALLPGGLEHKLLMGMPREPTIFKKVNDVVRCLDVYVNPGGCSWLHAVVRIDKQDEEDGKKAIAAAFAGHGSLKHVYIVDRDINIYDPLEIEWAMATRFQADRDLVLRDKAPGSSLDPSAEAGTHLTTRAGFDLTKPLHSVGKTFDRASFPEIDLSQFLEK